MKPVGVFFKRGNVVVTDHQDLKAEGLAGVMHDLHQLGH